MVKKKSVGNDWQKTPKQVKSYIFIVGVLIVSILLISAWVFIPKEGTIIGKGYGFIDTILSFFEDFFGIFGIDLDLSASELGAQVYNDDNVGIHISGSANIKDKAASGTITVTF